MTSSSVLRQGVLHALFSWRILKQRPCFSKIDYSIYYLRCMVTEILRFAEYYGIVISQPGGTAARTFSMTDSERAAMTSWKWSTVTFYLTFYLRCMVSEITRFYCKPDITSSSVLRQGALHALFPDGFWNSGHDFTAMGCSSVKV